jgi:hypothetical protein
MFALLHLGLLLVRVVLVVGSTPRCCAVQQFPRDEEKNHRASSKSHLTIVAWISKISIEFEFQSVMCDFSTVVIEGRLEGYPLVYSFCVSFTAVYSFGVSFTARVIHKVVSSFTFEVISFVCLFRKVVSSIVYSFDVLIIAVYSFDVPFIAVYSTYVIVITVYSFDVLVIAVYSMYVVIMTVYSFGVPFVARFFQKVVSSIRCDHSR